MMAQEYSDDEIEFSESEESEEDEEEKPVEEARKDAVYNIVGIHEKLEDIGWPEDIDWIQSLSVTVEDDELKAVDVNDDLAREMAFYTQALEGARDAYQKFEALGIPFLRPSDYYAEMVKSDTHMLKVKDKLLTQKKMMEEADERRKQREAKKFSKEVQAEKLKERAKQKKHDIESVKKWRKARSDSGYTEGEDEFPVNVENGGPSAKKRRVLASPGDRSGGKDRSGNPFGSQGRGRGSSSFRGGRGSSGSFRGGRTGKSGELGRGGGGRGGHRGGGRSGNREKRDAKYGHGGRKGLKKKNTAESAADDSSFRGMKRKGGF